VTRLLVAALVAITGGWTLVGCSAVPRPLLCDVSIVAVGDTTLKPGDPVPAGSLVLAAPGDFDHTAIEIVPDANNELALNLELRGDAINGTVVAIPMIQGPIPDGKLQITGGQGDTDLAKEFAGCVR
jgi:hypothetical protein